MVKPTIWQPFFRPKQNIPASKSNTPHLSYHLPLVQLTTCFHLGNNRQLPCLYPKNKEIVVMARKRNDPKLDELLEAIQTNPEQKPSWFATLLNRDNKSIMRDLPQLEDRGDMLMEDGNGQISWFGRRK